MPKRTTLQLFLIFFAAGLAFSSIGCTEPLMQSTNASDNIPAEAALPVVEAVQARLGALPLSERVNGTVVADNQVALYPEINGRITRVVVRDGEFVKRGAPLV